MYEFLPFSFQPVQELQFKLRLKYNYMKIATADSWLILRHCLLILRSLLAPITDGTDGGAHTLDRYTMMVVIHCPYHSDTLPDVSDTLPRHLSALPSPPNSTVNPTSCLNCSIIWGGALSYSYFLLTPTFSHTLAYPCTPMLTSCPNCSITWGRAFSPHIMSRPKNGYGCEGEQVSPPSVAISLSSKDPVMIGFCHLT